MLLPMSASTHIIIVGHQHCQQIPDGHMLDDDVGSLTEMVARPCMVAHRIATASARCATEYCDAVQGFYVAYVWHKRAPRSV